jgi:hypothetical protein
MAKVVFDLRAGRRLLGAEDQIYPKEENTKKGYHC